MKSFELKIMKTRLIMCVATFIAMLCGSYVFAQNPNSPVNDKNAIDYRYQKFENRLPRFADSIKARDKFYNVFSAGYGVWWEESQNVKSYSTSFSARFTLGYRFSPVHAIETDIIYSNKDSKDSWGANVNYVFNINNFATRRDNHSKFEALFIAGLSYRHFDNSRIGVNTGLRLQYNTGLNTGFFIEPKVTVLSGPKDAFSKLNTIPSVSVGMTLRFHKPNYYLWDYLTPFAIKTNLLYDAITAVNIGVEVPIRDRWSIAFEWICPWWGNTHSHKYFQLINGNIEGRYWFGNREKREQLTGLFAGISVGGGYYDFMFDDITNGKQGEFHTYSLVCGYAHTINKKGNLRLEYELGIGYLGSNYRKYWWDGYDYSLIAPTPQSWNYNWFGPTKAQVSLVYILKLRSKVGGRN